ncbi:MAG: glycosyltransferase family 2 protein [Thermoanaerobaculales bacterium]|nr:glycosyltransferase family 2 protein [Thermoanaerobaculales bacterium]
MAKSTVGGLEPAVSVVIPCRNEESAIRTCLDSLIVQAEPPGGFEVLVVDGMSDDGTREIVSRYVSLVPKVKMIDNPKRTTPAALNIGIRVARGEVVVRADVHTEYASDYVKCCLEVLRGTLADNVGGPARTTTTGLRQAAIAAGYHSWFSVGGARFHKAGYEGPVDTVTYGCWPKETFERFGFFDEELVRNQDDEHNIRIVRGGGLVWQSPRIRSWYRPRSGLPDLFRQYFQYGYWKVRVIRKHHLPGSWRHLVPGLFVVSLLVLLLASTFSKTARWLMAAELMTYLCCNMMASYLAARTQRRWGLMPILLGVFPTFHISYGMGFLLGVVDFIVLRRSPREFAGKLTRPSSH